MLPDVALTMPLVFPAELHIPDPLTKEEEEDLQRPLQPLSGKGPRRRGPVALGKQAAAGARGAVATGGWAGDAEHEQVAVESSLPQFSCFVVWRAYWATHNACETVAKGCLTRPNGASFLSETVAGFAGHEPGPT